MPIFFKIIHYSLLEAQHKHKRNSTKTFALGIAVIKRCVFFLSLGFENQKVGESFELSPIRLNEL
jgi:hypothetical protein